MESSSVARSEDDRRRAGVESLGRRCRACPLHQGCNIITDCFRATVGRDEERRFAAEDGNQSLSGLPRKLWRAASCAPSVRLQRFNRHRAYALQQTEMGLKSMANQGMRKLGQRAVVNIGSVRSP
jgi:hypothetical protein